MICRICSIISSIMLFKKILLTLSTYNEPNQINDARCWIHISPKETLRITLGTAAGAGHGCGAGGGVVFDVEGFEDVAAVGATE